MPPHVVGPYRIENTLGRGGIGTVFRARDVRTNEDVALKLLSSGPALDPIAARRMVREFEALAELAHPNVVRVFDAGVFQGYPYLVMELVEGLDLRSYLSIDLREPRPSLFTRDDPSAVAWDQQIDEPAPRPSGGKLFTLDEMLGEPDTGTFALEYPRGKQALETWAREKEEPDTDDSWSESRSWSGDERGGQADWVLEGIPVFEDVEEPARQLDQATPLTRALNRPERVARLKDAVVQICEALGYIHSHGLVHRDLKPGNILVDDDRRVRLMDFGLAKFLAEDNTVTATGKVVGTYRYMAPEQALGEPVDGRSDLYALGVVIYELLAGRPPFDGRTPLELWQQLLDREPASLFAINPHVDEDLARLAHKLLRKDPDERYQTAEEIVDLLLAG
ncbi:serine/threonine-protein kinase [Vulgatibacter sp.]|uniref:serine/threonine-protein kinase n=1 Tax=Vulgatibacter sp. TaxID=1971226 RepID=UPI0035680B5D